MQSTNLITPALALLCLRKRVLPSGLLATILLAVFGVAGSALRAAQSGKSADQPPKATVTVAPAYSANLMRAGLEGKVVVIFTVDAQGNVTKPRIVSAPDLDFHDPVLVAISKWKFAPAVRNGVAVAAEVTQVFTFSLKPKQS